MNPILPVQHFVPDAEARQWQDGRMYIYGSYDFSGDTNYCSYEYRVFSSNDLVNWTDHGISFTTPKADPQVQWREFPLYAPDCIYRDGLYYLYFCMADNSEGVATSPSPYGPFENPVPVEGAHGDAIDPAIFIDDDGEAYYYWGQFNLRGARLNPDMKSIDSSTLNSNLINEKEHGFHEGASMRKHNGVYYLVYTDTSRGSATCMAYATSKSPLGPFEKGGIIVDNTGCDRETWNNHGSIAECNGKWYVFYHRSSQASKFSRRVCVEPICFNEDGSIPEVEMTTQGVSAPLRAVSRIDAYRACLLSGMIRTEGVGINEKNDTCSEHLSFIHDRDWAGYKYIDFEEGVSSFEVRAASLSYGGEIEIRIDSPEGPVIGMCIVPHTGGWQNWKTVSCPVRNTTGIHAVYLGFKGRWGRLMSMDSFTFRK
jgi:arabinoxylan arabinofuranohydrolase